MTLVYSQPGGSNAYVPELTSKLVVSFSRSTEDWPVNRYCQIVPVEKQVGRYVEMTREQAGRIYDNGKAEWPDGKDRPIHNGELETFGFKPYETHRRDFGFNLGNLTSEQASWDVKNENAGIAAEQAMRYRTSKVLANATTSGNYLAAHTSAVSSISGVSGKWDVSTTARKDIKRSIDHAINTIINNTLNGVRAKNFFLVMSAGCARKISVSQEIIDMIKQSPVAYAEVQGTLPNQNVLFGLPRQLYGMEVIIEDTAKVTSKKGATKVAAAMLADSTPFICSRIGGLVNNRTSESPSWSTHVLFMKEEMSVEEFNEPKHRRVEHHVTEDYDAVMPSNISGFLFTAAVD